jgi:flagellar biosynthesis protein FliP
VRILAAFILTLLVLTSPARGREIQGPGLSTSAKGTMGPTLPTPELSMEGGINPLSVFDAASKALPGGNPGGGDAQGAGLSPIVSVLVMLTVISLAPAIMLMTTCFVRIIVVLGLLKQAMGTQTIPPAQVTTALALFMTMLVMSPTIERINAEAIVPYQKGEIRDYDTLWDAAKQPMRDFMFAQIDATGNWSSVYMVLDYRGVDTSEPEKLTRADVDMVTLVPAFLLSELKTAFIMGFRIYLPFLVIDMVISTILISMSMMMLPPVMISLPFKLLLFVMVDGWQLITGSLMRSFEQPPPPAPTASILSMLGQQVPIVQPVLSSLAGLAEGVRLVA